MENMQLTTIAQEREKEKEEAVIGEELSGYQGRAIRVTEKLVGILPKSKTKSAGYKAKEKEEVGKIACKEKRGVKQ